MESPKFCQFFVLESELIFLSSFSGYGEFRNLNKHSWLRIIFLHVLDISKNTGCLENGVIINIVDKE